MEGRNADCQSSVELEGLELKYWTDFTIEAYYSSSATTGVGCTQARDRIAMATAYKY